MSPATGSTRRLARSSTFPRETGPGVTRRGTTALDRRRGTLPVKRAEIRWYRFASPDKRRPVLVLTRDSIIPYLGEVTVAPVTTRIRDIPSEVLLSMEDGMPRECAVNCDHVQTVQRGKLGALITTLSPRVMEQVATAVRFALDLG